MANNESSNNITGNESIEELEAWLDGLEEDDGVDEPPTEAKKSSNDDDLKANDDVIADKATDTATVGTESSEIDAQKVIESKNGGHTIPYSELEKARAETQTLQQQIKELQAGHQTHEKTQRMVESRNKQLTALGVEPEDLPEDVVVSDDELAQMAEDYPEIGRAMMAMNQKIKAISPQEQQQSAEQTSQDNDDVGQMIQSIPELAEMQKSGGDDWQRAIELDDQLMADPNWQGKTQVERFQEVTRQVVTEKSTSSRDTAERVANQAIDKAKGTLPSSPSEIGNSHVHQQSNAEFMASANAAEMQAKFMDMDMDEMEAMLTE